MIEKRFTKEEFEECIVFVLALLFMFIVYYVVFRFWVIQGVIK